MNREELRVEVQTALLTAREQVRRYGERRCIDSVFLKAICAAVGDISVDEAMDAIDKAEADRPGTGPA